MEKLCGDTTLVDECIRSSVRRCCQESNQLTRDDRGRFDCRSIVFVVRSTLEPKVGDAVTEGMEHGRLWHALVDCRSVLAAEHSSRKPEERNARFKVRCGVQRGSLYKAKLAVRVHLLRLLGC